MSSHAPGAADGERDLRLLTDWHLKPHRERGIYGLSCGHITAQVALPPSPWRAASIHLAFRRCINFTTFQLPQAQCARGLARATRSGLGHGQCKHRSLRVRARSPNADSPCRTTCSQNFFLPSSSRETIVTSFASFSLTFSASQTEPILWIQVRLTKLPSVKHTQELLGKMPLGGTSIA